MSVRTSTPRFTASASAFSISGTLRPKMWTSMLFLALRIAASVGPTPSPGWTRSSMRSGLVLARLALPLHRHLVATIESHDRACELVRLLGEGKLHRVREVFLRRRAELVPYALAAKQLLQSPLEPVRLLRLPAKGE